jgi:pimeloyl-ACP methyl ester carboxylesterase
MATEPTIVLVHGAFADGSSWDGVIERLQRKGYTAIAPAIGLRGVGEDARCLRSVVDQIEGAGRPRRTLVRRPVISNMPTDANVVGLVFVAAFVPDLEEALAT